MYRAKGRYTRIAGLGLVVLLGLEFCAAAEVEYGDDVLDEDSSDGASFEAPRPANSPLMTVVSSIDESIVLAAAEECGHANADGQEITELVLNRTVHCKVSSSEAPRIFCYRHYLPFHLSKRIMFENTHTHTHSFMYLQSFVHTFTCTYSLYIPNQGLAQASTIQHINSCN